MKKCRDSIEKRIEGDKVKVVKKKKEKELHQKSRFFSSHSITLESFFEKKKPLNLKLDYKLNLLYVRVRSSMNSNLKFDQT